jgi:hypothetical protein
MAVLAEPWFSSESDERAGNEFKRTVARKIGNVANGSRA